MKAEMLRLCVTYMYFLKDNEGYNEKKKKTYFSKALFPIFSMEINSTRAQNFQSIFQPLCWLSAEYPRQ